MKTLTITDAKKNLGRWLQAACRGEDIGIISGANVVALRRVEVESTDYAWREYGATDAELKRFADDMETRYRKQKRAGKLKMHDVEQLKELARREKATLD